MSKSIYKIGQSTYSIDNKLTVEQLQEKINQLRQDLDPENPKHKLTEAFVNNTIGKINALEDRIKNITRDKKLAEAKELKIEFALILLNSEVLWVRTELAHLSTRLNYAPHKEALEQLSQQLETHLRAFEQHPTKSNLAKFKEHCERDVAAAEKHFSDEPGIWNNFFKPLVNALLHIINTIIDALGLSAKHKSGFFKTQAQTDWEIIKPTLPQSLDEQDLDNDVAPRTPRA